MQLMLPSLRRKRAEELLRVQHTVAQILAEPAEAAVLRAASTGTTALQHPF